LRIIADKGEGRALPWSLDVASIPDFAQLQSKQHSPHLTTTAPESTVSEAPPARHFQQKLRFPYSGQSNCFDEVRESAAVISMQDRQKNCCRALISMFGLLNLVQSSTFEVPWSLPSSPNSTGRKDDKGDLYASTSRTTSTRTRAHQRCWALNGINRVISTCNRHLLGAKGAILNRLG